MKRICEFCKKQFTWRESRGKRFCCHSCWTKYRNMIYGNPMKSPKAKEKSSLSHKGKHYSPTTEFKKGQHYSPKTEIKNGQHLSQETEFKKGQKAWNKEKSNYWCKGEKHPRWLGGRTPRTNQWEWQKIRQQVWKRDNYTCQECDKINCRLNAHHIIPYKISHDNSLNNLITLCDNCHSKIENQIIKILKENIEWKIKKYLLQPLVVCH